MINTEQSADAAKIVAFDIQSDGFFPDFFRIALPLRLRRKSFAAVAAQIALCAAMSFPAFYLVF
jgi:hypothetical protein